VLAIAAKNFTHASPTETALLAGGVGVGVGVGLGSFKRSQLLSTFQ